MKPIERLDQFRRIQKIKATVFEKNLGYSHNSFSNAVSRGYGIKGDTISKILEHYPTLNINWLFTGNGNMLIDEGGDISKSFDEPNLYYIYELMEQIDPDNTHLETSALLRKEVIKLFSLYDTLSREIAELKKISDQL
ncbi:MAG: hypothetical protein AAFO69_15645 [Bacteroidota bacterium]